MIMHSMEFNKPVVVGIVVVLFVLSLFVSRSDVGGTGFWSDGTVSAPLSNQTETTSPPETAPPNTTPARTAPVGGLTYEEAVELYGGFRYQFIDCRGTPGSMTLKKGSAYMLDNRDNEKHTIKVGPRTYALAAYGFRIVTANDVGTLNITCDGGGAAQLIVQP